MLRATAILMTSLVFGGTTLFSAGFAAVLFAALPAQAARSTLRHAFPSFYLFVALTSACSALLWWSMDPLSSYALVTVTLTTIPTRQLLMPAINHASDTGNKVGFKLLHGASVLVTLGHIAITGWVLSRL